MPDTSSKLDDDEKCLFDKLLGEINSPSPQPNVEEPDVLDQEEKVMFSLDLTEATYNMAHELLSEQSTVLDVMLKDFPPWMVFREVFTTFKREVDMTDLVEKGYYNGSPVLETKSGSFMGDVMSFIHLSLFLRGSVLSTGFKEKPLGQSVGDDLILLKVLRRHAEELKKTLSKLGARFSKINSISNDSCTFCENCCVIPIDSDELAFYAKGSQFGDLYYLDIIKGSVLSGKSKVKTTGAMPFFGHATMLNKQIAWHPIKWVAERSKTFLWVKNFHHAKKLSSSMASLPRALGGIDLAIGPIIKINDDKFQTEFLPYYDAIVRCADDKVFFAFYTLLQGIYKAEPKGLPYTNSSNTILQILTDIDIYRAGRDVNTLLPTYLHEKPIAQKLRYLSREMNLESISWLVNEISRREAFVRFWKGDHPNSFMTLPIKEPYTRWKDVWKEIRRHFTPRRNVYEYTSMQQLSSQFEARLWNVYFNKEDDAITNALGGCPSLFLNFGKDWLD
jgi:hypothetical protein